MIKDTNEYISNISISSFVKPETSKPASKDLEIEGLVWKFGRSQTIVAGYQLC
jgi:hypothetical protein